MPSGAALVVFTLRTPGGLVDSTREIITRMLAAKTPVVDPSSRPSGARAASAGFMLTIAADRRGDGAGHAHRRRPSGGGRRRRQMDETTVEEGAEDIAAYARTLAGKRGRNVQLAEQAVLREQGLHRRGGTQRGAAAHRRDRHRTCHDLLEETRRSHRHALRWPYRHAAHRLGRHRARSTMTLRQRILSAVAHPNIAYILLSLGTLGLTIELWSPGAVLPGVVGGLSLLLAFFALQVLPVNYAGLLLMLFGLLLFVLEIKVTSLRAADGRRHHQPDLRIDDADRFAGARAAAEPRRRHAGRRLGSRRSRHFSSASALAAQRHAAGDRRRRAVERDRRRAAHRSRQAHAGRVRVHGEIWKATANEPILKRRSRAL